MKSQKNQAVEGKKTKSLVELFISPGKVQLKEYYSSEESLKLAEELEKYGLKIKLKYLSPCG